MERESVDDEVEGSAIGSRIDDEVRLNALRRLEILDSPPEPIFDRITNLLRRIIDTRGTSLSFIDGKGEFCKSAIGIPEPWASRRALPLTHSYARKIIEQGQPLNIHDATAEPELADHHALKEIGMRAFLGYPVKTRAGQTVGALYAFHDRPREWSSAEEASLEDLASLTSMILDLRTERIRRDELEQQFQHAQKLESVGRLASGIAHDFNSVLTAIAGNASLLLTELEGGVLERSGLEEILYSAERGTLLTRQLLLLTKSHEGGSATSLDLNAVIREMERLLRRLIGSDIELVTRLDPSSIRVPVERSRLEQILMNLIINARDAMPEGGVIEIETEGLELRGDEFPTGVVAGGGSYVRLRVIDTGIGIDASIVDQIFEPYFTTKTKDEGTGLGLSTVHQIVTSAGGGIRVESRPAEGSTFEIYLPSG